jgi:acyl-CoA thioesterase
MGEYAFDEDSRVEPGADGEYIAELTGRWDGMRGAVNGGYLLATCTRALALTMPFPDPIVISGFFLRPGTAGAATVRTSLVRGGRTTAFGEAVLTQEGKEVIRATAAFAHLGQDGQVFLGGAPPDLPPPGECVRLPASGPGLPRIAERIDFRRAELPGWFRGEPTGQPSSEFWMRFADGRDADLLALPLLVDANPPPVLELGVSTTTIQLTVHLRAKPAPGWLACRATTSFVSGGYHEEDFEIWDSAGTLVAQSRQLALILPLLLCGRCYSAGAGMQADRVARPLAAQPVPLAVHPQRAGTQSRAGRSALGCLARDHRHHVAITRLTAIAGRQDHQPGMVRRMVFDADPHRTVPLEPDQSPPAFRCGGDHPELAGQRAERQPGPGGIATLRVAGVFWSTRVRACGRPRGDQQDGFGQPGDLRGSGHVCDHRTFLRVRLLTGRPQGGATRTTTVSWGRCQRQHEGQSTRAIIKATPEWSP